LVQTYQICIKMHHVLQHLEMKHSIYVGPSIQN
jgi:hypothetical protein